MGGGTSLPPASPRLVPEGGEHSQSPAAALTRVAALPSGGCSFSRKYFVFAQTALVLEDVPWMYR